MIASSSGCYSNRGASVGQGVVYNAVEVAGVPEIKFTSDVV